MPPHLHPRSRSTTSLFGITLLASFVVVGVPHIFPCPAPRRTLADSQIVTTADGRQIQRLRRRRLRSENSNDASPSTPTPRNTTTSISADEEVTTFLQTEEEAERLASLRRECPVPKPGGRIGALLGFTTQPTKKSDDGDHC